MSPEQQSALNLAAKHRGIAERVRFYRLTLKHYRKAQMHLSRAARYAVQEKPI